jgi:hypothetical protein
VTYLLTLPHIYIYNVAYRPAAKRRLCKQQQLLGNGSANTPFAKQQILNNAAVGLQQWELYVSTWFVTKCYKHVIYQLKVSSAREALKRGPQRVKLKNLHC